MPDPTQRRDAERVASDLQLEFQVLGSGKKGTGQARNLSSTGVQFVTYEKLAPGMKIQIRIPFVNPNTPSLMRPAEVVRCRVVAGGQGYAVACAFD